MPDFPIVDAHVHLWDPQVFRIPWLDGNLLLDHRYGVEDFREHTVGIAIDAIVYIEVNVDPAYALIEPRRIAEIAEAEPRIQAMVAWAPLEYGERARIYLDALTATGPLVRGVRRITQGEADPAFCLRPDFVRGVQLLPRYGLTCDLCIKHHQLEATIELVRRCPEVTFMLDHIAKPDIASGRLDPWRAEMRAMAELPNVWCKISGMATEADMPSWQPADLAPYVQHTLEVFGEDRVVFGGDWPVVLLASSYRQWVETLDGLTSGLSAGARRKLWAENARAFYRIST